MVEKGLVLKIMIKQMREFDMDVGENRGREIGLGEGLKPLFC